MPSCVGRTIAVTIRCITRLCPKSLNDKRQDKSVKRLALHGCWPSAVALSLTIFSSALANSPFGNLVAMPKAPTASPKSSSPADATAKRPDKGTRPGRAGREPSRSRPTIVEFENSPFPYDGMIPEQNKPFLEGPVGARFHVAPRGGKLMAGKTYMDRRSLLGVSATFDPAKPDAAVVIYFHGNLSSLEDVMDRQGVARQVLASGLNAALVVPALAVRALDSSPGHFYEPGFFEKYLDEAESRLTAQAGGRFTKEQLAKLPIVIVAYSGGYLATAFSLHYMLKGDNRIRGIILLDALFGESGKFEEWTKAHHQSTFFVSAFSKASSGTNADLEQALTLAGIPIMTRLPKALAPGDVVFLAAPQAVHQDFVTRAWVNDPLAVVLAAARPALAQSFGSKRDAPGGHVREAVPPDLSPCPADAPDCNPASRGPKGAD